MKKLVSLILAIMMIAVCATAWAAGDAGRTVGTKTDTYSGANQTDATSMAKTTSIPLNKSIVFVNANGSAVYEPNISFSYAIEPATIAESTYTVNDGTNEGYVHPGVATGLSTSATITFGVSVDSTPTTAVTTSANGVDVERTTNLTVTPSSFPRPGIYRYKITETPNPSDITTVGLTARTSDYNNVRFLDVYIRRDITTDALEMYGAVIFKSTTDTAGQDNITTSTTKTTGFTPTSGTLKDDASVDRYTTYDFTIKKTVDGSMADKNNQFPFYVSVTNSISGAKFTYTADGSEAFTGATNSSGAVTLSAAAFQIGEDAKTSSLALKHNEQIVLIGVPSNQTNSLAVVVKEYNNTYDKYVPSVSAKSGTITLTSTNATTGNAMTAFTGNDTTSSFAVKTNDVASQTITINNNLTEISPTGYVSRFAPYALILVAGIALLIVAKKRKPAMDDEE